MRYEAKLATNYLTIAGYGCYTIQTGIVVYAEKYHEFSWENQVSKFYLKSQSNMKIFKKYHEVSKSITTLPKESKSQETFQFTFFLAFTSIDSVAAYLDKTTCNYAKVMQPAKMTYKGAAIDEYILGVRKDT